MQKQERSGRKNEFPGKKRIRDYLDDQGIGKLALELNDENRELNSNKEKLKFHLN